MSNEYKERELFNNTKAMRGKEGKVHRIAIQRDIKTLNIFPHIGHLCRPVRGGGPPLQAGPGRPGKDERPRPSRRRHHAQYSGPGLQVGT